MSNLPIRTSTGEAAILEEGAVASLSSNVRGAVLRPGDQGYDEGRAVWNGMIDRRPALIVGCTGAEDVLEAVRFARTHNLLVSVRGGSHGVAGLATCEGGIVIDLSAMKDVHVDPQARTVRAGGGAKWGDLDPATQAFGLAAPGGVVSDTGIAGLTLGGGYGHLRNKYGLSCDNLISAQVVTADGRLVRASETENPDLFWGIRGGGGNFGVVTSFQYRLHPVGPEVMFCLVFYHGEKTGRALRFTREFTAAAPDEISLITVLGVVPPGHEAYPREIHGIPFAAFLACYAGPPEQGERALQPLRDFSDPLIDFSSRMPYVEVQKVLDADYPARELRYYWKSLNLLELSDEAIDLIVARVKNQPSPLTTTDIWHLGGVVPRMSDDSCAYNGRHVPFLVNAEANWKDPQDDKANMAWARGLIDDMKPFSDGGRYLNFPGFMEEGDAMMRAAFGHKYERLVDLKNKYDPTNLFRLNQNIKPSAT